MVIAVVFQPLPKKPSGACINLIGMRELSRSSDGGCDGGGGGG